MLDMHEVIGSIPTVSTKYKTDCVSNPFLFFVKFSTFSLDE